MRRPGYRDALDWLANNDDCYWLGEPQYGMSVAASLVRDLFDVPDERFVKDLRRTLAKVHPDHAGLRAREGGK